MTPGGVTVASCVTAGAAGLLSLLWLIATLSSLFTRPRAKGGMRYREVVVVVLSVLLMAGMGMIFFSVRS